MVESVGLISLSGLGLNDLGFITLRAVTLAALFNIAHRAETHTRKT